MARNVFPELTASFEDLLHMQDSKLGQWQLFSILQCFVVLMYHTILVTLWKSMRPENSSSHKNQEA